MTGVQGGGGIRDYGIIGTWNEFRNMAIAQRLHVFPYTVVPYTLSPQEKEWC